MKYQPVKIAAIGSGMISDTYYQNLKNRFYITDLVGCADMVDEKASKQAEKYGIRKMTVDEILSDPSIELVANLTYAASHYEISKKILEAGKHLYSEKMLASDMQEADELKALYEKSGRMAAAAPDTFLGATLQSARHYLDMGMIGAPIVGSIVLGRSYQLIKSDEDDAYRRFSVMRRGGGLPYDMGGYYLHALFNMFGPVKAVSGRMFTRNANRPQLNPRHTDFGDNFFVDTPNTLAATLEFRSGFLCNIAMTSDAGAGEHVFEILGDEGTLYVGDPNEFGDANRIKRRGAETQEMPLLCPFRESLRGIGIADMCWALRTGRKPRLSFEMGYHALEVIEAIGEAGETGKRIELAATLERAAPISTRSYAGGAEERSLAAQL
ncbi:MAG: Gfo/Idh/MocA family oxidoreductase [Clostridia bacterium]|nr:Gfo/Idh/MocA family oxidoreductase [Clostridia bacterium]